MVSRTRDIINSLYPSVNENKTLLPRYWSLLYGGNHLELFDEGVQVQYKLEDVSYEIAYASTLHPIPPSCGIYYFEITVLNSAGYDDEIGIGVLSDIEKQKNSTTDLHVPLSTELLTFDMIDGIHSISFCIGDVLGCGINFVNKTIFYTENGEICETREITGEETIYAAIGLRNPGDCVMTNFGTEPFIFNKLEYIKRETRQNILKDINILSIWNKENVCEKEVANQFVYHYLVENAYCETASIFNKVASIENIESECSIKQRKIIKLLILKGDYTKAITAVDLCYPNLLEVNKIVKLMLMCGQFIEMIRRGVHLFKPLSNYFPKRKVSTQTKPTEKSPNLLIPNLVDELDDISSSDEKSNSDLKLENYPSTSSMKLESSEKDVEVDEDAYFDFNMEGDKDKETFFILGGQILNLALDLKIDGKLLKCQSEMLEKMFALVAYEYPWQSPFFDLMGLKQKELIIYYVNTTILRYLGLNKDKIRIEDAVIGVDRLLTNMKEQSCPEIAFISINDVLPD